MNKRLKGDKTEDPMHPKVQFPTKEKCPDCFDWKDDYLENKVLNYLNKVYGSEAISSDGSDNTSGSVSVVISPILMLGSLVRLLV